ncbi:MAG: DoxX family protein [Phycisphaerales bacterium]
MSFLKVIETVMLQFVVRIALGGLFCLAAFKKISDPQSFAEAIKGFKILDVAQFEPMIISAAYTIPWVEMIAGVLLILGLWTRAAALTIGFALLMFIGGLISVIQRELDASCSCFGDLKLFCGAEVGWCQVLRNLVLLIPTGYLVWRKGGLLAVDKVFDRQRTTTPSASPEGSKSTEKSAASPEIEFDPIGDRA